MRNMTKILAGAAGMAAMAAAAPAAAQYYPNGYSNPYSYNNGYSAYGATNPSVAASQCTAAVQNRLYNRTSLGQILGSLVGIPSAQGRVVAVTSTTPTRSGMRIRG